MKWRPDADLAYPESVPRNHTYEQHAGGVRRMPILRSRVRRNAVEACPE